MKTLHVSDDLALPQTTVTSTGVVYGGKGMGKSILLAVIMEELARARLHFSALDAMGVLWGIRHDVSGKGPGFEVLTLGGIHGDIPIEPTGGAVVADLVTDEDVSVVIDISRRRCAIPRFGRQLRGWRRPGPHRTRRSISPVPRRGGATPPRAAPRSARWSR